MTYANRTKGFRLIPLAAAVLLGAAAFPAAASELDPSDRAPGWISQRSFDALSTADIYRIDRAQKLGKQVIIEGHTASESRAIVDDALGGNAVTRSSTGINR